VAAGYIPHMAVSENMGFALKLSRVPTAERIARVREAAQLLLLQGSSTTSRVPCLQPHMGPFWSW